MSILSPRTAALQSHLIDIYREVDAIFNQYQSPESLLPITRLDSSLPIKRQGKPPIGSAI